ncbi:MAG: FecR domain-containing protein [Deltaproteobacteria bacterium]|nr:FecR domain-containing protein [Deltaproteobacteria bacterium]
MVGSLQEVHGNVYVFHAGETSAFQLKKDLPVFQGDTLVAMTRSRAIVKLQDESAFALAPGSKLVIDKSIYDPAKNERSSFLKLLFGRARFFVAKLKGKTDYKVGTPTAVCGLRGSDFALAVFPYKEKTSWLENLTASLNPVPPAYAQDPSAVLATVVCTGEQTTITFTGLMAPLQNLGPIQLSWAPPGQAASSPIQVTLGQALGALNSVGPNLAAISMPPGSDASLD